MKRKILFSLLAIGAIAITSCKNNSPDGQCDKVIYGNIYVGDNSEKTVEAIAIKDGVIEYAGDKAGAKVYEQKAKEVSTFSNGEFIMPGIVDGHSHPAVSWDSKINALMLNEGQDLDTYIKEIKKYVEKNPNEVVYRVNGFIESKFTTDEQKNNPKALLDAISTEVPIVATDSGGHCIWCNSKAIDMVCEKYPNIKKVDAEHPGHDLDSISGGTIERNNLGEAIGFFRDKGTAIVNNACVKFTKESYKKAIINAQNEYLSIGYTAYNESMINESADVTQTPKYDAYNELEASGELKLYVAGSFIVGNREDSEALVDQAIRLKNETKGGNFEVTDIKIFMDGVVEGGSAYLKDPYVLNIDGTKAGDYRGSSAWASDLEKLTRVIAKANNAGMACHFHAVGDQASLDALYCIEKAAEQIGVDKVKAVRNVITHLQIVDDSVYEKFANYDIIANLNPWASKGPGFYEEVEVKLLGKDRASNEYPYKTFLDKGIHCSFGTDYGSSFTYHLNDSFFILTKRKYVNPTTGAISAGTELKTSECLSPTQAINIMCAGGAYQFKKENEFGKLEKGMKANLIVVNNNLLTANEQEIVASATQKTMINGEWVYSKAN